MLRKIKNFGYCSQYSINLSKIKMIILKYYYVLQYYIVCRYMEVYEVYLHSQR